MESDTLEMQAILSRIETVEKENRRLKRYALAALLLTGILVLTGQARPGHTIEANEFVLRDAAGRARARLSLESMQRPTLTFYQENGQLAASLAGGEEPFLTLSRAGSNEQASLEATKGFCGLGVYDKTIRAGLSIQNGVPGLDLFDERGKKTAAIASESTTGPSLNLNDPEGKAGFTLWVAPLGIGPDFSMYNGAGKLGVDITDLVETGPSLKLTDPDGYSTVIGSANLVQARTGEKHKTSAASLVLFGKDKEVLWSAP